RYVTPANADSFHCHSCTVSSCRIMLTERRRQVSAEYDEAAVFASADNPISDELHEGTSLVVGASLVAAESIQSGAALHAFSPSGGLHHAHRARPSGVCSYTAAAVACRWLKDRGPGVPPV